MRKIKNFSIRKNKDGSERYYWQPNSQYKKFGFKCTSLSPVLSIAKDQAIELQNKFEKWLEQNVGMLSRPEKRQADKRGSFDALVKELYIDRKYQALADKTKKEIQDNVEFWRQFFHGIFVASITRTDVETIYYNLLNKKSVFVANSKLKTLRKLLNFAIRKQYIMQNPIALFELEKAPARTSVWNDNAFDALFNTAKQSRFSIALAIMLARWTGQRQGDVLNMKWSDIADGHIHVRQHKTGVDVFVTIVPELAFMLNQARKNNSSDYIIINEETGKRYTGDNFRHWFKKIWTVAVKNNPEIDFSNLKFIDLRRTLITDLADHGCTDSEIRSISGHSGNSRIVHSVYRQNTARQADNAMNKLIGLSVITNPAFEQAG